MGFCVLIIILFAIAGVSFGLKESKQGQKIVLISRYELEKMKRQEAKKKINYPDSQLLKA